MIDLFAREVSAPESFAGQASLNRLPPQEGFPSQDGVPQQDLPFNASMLDLLPIGVCAVALDGSLTQYNSSAAELWGQSPPVGTDSLRFTGAFKIFTAAGEPLAPEATPLAEVLRGGEPVRDREMLVERPDGMRIYLLVNADPLRDAKGTLSGAVACFQDITARKAAEETLRGREQWYRDLLQALPAAIYTTDAEGRITFYNEAAASLSGRRPELGEDEWCVTLKLFTADGVPLPHEACPMATALKTGVAVRDVEAICERPDGTRVPFLPYPTPLRNESGAVIGAVNMLVDISEQKRGEEQRMILLRELAHRVNNSFAVILAMTQQSLHTAASPQAFAEGFTGRVQALAKAHNLLLERDWIGGELAELVDSQLVLLSPGLTDRVSIGGPRVLLSPTQMVALGVVLHELGTNAYRFGALSGSGGGVNVRWTTETRDGVDHVCLEWVEHGGPSVRPPARHGLGSRIIERGLPNASIAWRFEPEGLVCSIALPLEVPQEGRAYPLVHAAE